MVRRPISVAIAATALLLAFSATHAHAQYMYLDSNGDGVHDSADSLSSTGTTVADVWLVTNLSRGGGTVVCMQEIGTPFSINSYEVSLHAEGGSVVFGTFQNLQPTMTVRFGSAHDTTDLYAGYGGSTSYPPGVYRLGRVSIDVVSGTPSIEIVSTTPFFSWPGTTSFGSMCVGLDYDNTLKLGSDWFDADGLRAAGATIAPGNLAPRFDPVAPVAMLEGEVAERSLVVTDSDSDALTLSVLETPRYVTVAAPQLSPGRLEASVRIAPNFFDAGSSQLVVAASDGVNRSAIALHIDVSNSNRAPLFDPIADVEVEYGVMSRVPVIVRDPDLEYITARIESGPGFATIAPTWPAVGLYEGAVFLAPTETDVGAWQIVLGATDGIATVMDSFQVTILPTSPNHSPALDSIPDFTIGQGGFLLCDVSATDPDSGPLTATKSGAPYWVFLEQAYWQDGVNHWSLWGHVPDTGVGTWRPTITVSDGVLWASRTFQLTVVDSALAPRFYSDGWWCASQGEVRSHYVQVLDADDDLLTVAYGPTPPWGTTTDASPSRRYYTFAPTSDDPPQEFPIEIVATDATGLVSRQTFYAEVTEPGVCRSPFAGDPSGGPPAIPDAGGPYAGLAGVPIHLDGSGTINDAGREYHWAFGDGTTGLGRAMNHPYREGGTYKAMLCMVDRYAATSVCDSAVVVVRDALPARAFQPADETPIVLRAARAQVELGMERVGEEYALEDIDPATLCLWSAGHGDVDSIFAQAGKTARVEDRDRNGVPERSVAFAREDIRRLFSTVRGKRTIAARLEGRLPSGARVRAPLDIVVLGAPPQGVAVWPNPLNPRGTISFQASRPGRATVRLYDVNGRLVRTLLDGDVVPGEVRVPFDGVDSRGRALGSGVYFYLVTTGDGEWGGRATILK